jgi:hypothetical protein
MWKDLHRWIFGRGTSSVADKQVPRPTPRLSHPGGRGRQHWQQAIGSKREVVADRIWLLNCGGRSSVCEPGSDDDTFGSDVPL